MVGCSTAIALRRAGLSVAIVDRSGGGRGASAVNFGGVRQHGRKLEELALAIRARRIWDDLPALIGTDGEFVRSGHLYVAPDEAAMAWLERFHADATGYGVDTELLTPAALRELCPWIGGDMAGGSLCRDDGHANPRLVAAAFIRTATGLGAELITATVTALVPIEGGLAVESDGAPLRAGTVVNAANAGASALAQALGDRIDVAVVAPTCMVTEPLPPLIAHNVGVIGGDLGLRQVARGNVVIGGGHSRADMQNARAEPLSETCAVVLRSAARWAPALAQARLLRSWAGLETVTADHLPVIGWSPRAKNLIHAFGFSEHGFEIAPAAGEAIAELITIGRTTVPIEALSPARFAA